MKMVYGLRVMRSGGRLNKASSHVVWVSRDESKLAARRDFIRDKVHNEDADGNLSFEIVTREPVIHRPGRYKTRKGLIAEIDSVKEDGMICSGYLVEKKANRIKRTFCHWHVTGSYASVGQHMNDIVGAA